MTLDMCMAQGWPGASVWPDFDSKEGVQWWQSEMEVRLKASDVLSEMERLPLLPS